MVMAISRAIPRGHDLLWGESRGEGVSREALSIGLSRLK